MPELSKRQDILMNNQTNYDILRVPEYSIGRVYEIYEYLNTNIDTYSHPYFKLIYLTSKQAFTLNACFLDHLLSTWAICVEKSERQILLFMGLKPGCFSRRGRCYTIAPLYHCLPHTYTTISMPQSYGHNSS